MHSAACFFSCALVGVQPSVTSKEGDEEEELYRTNQHGYKVKRELSDDELPEEVRKCRTRSHDDSSNGSKGDNNEAELQSLEHYQSSTCQNWRAYCVGAAEGEVGELCMAAWPHYKPRQLSVSPQRQQTSTHDQV